MSNGESDLSTLLHNLSPQLLAGDYVFCTVQCSALSEVAHFNPIAVFVEGEGTTLVLQRAIAEEAGFAADEPMRCITLAVHSSLTAVGLTAAVSSALTQHNISANIIAAYHHDHVFVPASCADKALSILQTLPADTSQVLA